MMNGILDLQLIGRVFVWMYNALGSVLSQEPSERKDNEQPIYMWGVGFKKRSVSTETLIHSNLHPLQRS